MILCINRKHSQGGTCRKYLPYRWDEHGRHPEQDCFEERG